MQIAELEEIVAGLRALGADVGEIEVKKAEGGLPKSLRETISAFSNTIGGLVILGLDESNEFVASGVADPSKMAADLASMCSSEFEPVVRPTIDAVEFEGVWLILAEIPEIDPSVKPCFYKPKGMTAGSYTRVNDGDHQLSAYEVQVLVSNRGQPREDVAAVEDASVDDLDTVLVRQYLDRLRTTRTVVFADLPDEEILARTRMTLTDARGMARPTVAGLLALGTFPQEFFPQLNVTLVVYPTNEGPDVASGTRFLDNVTLDGAIPVMARDALSAVRRNMKRRSSVSGVGRSEIWEYPEAALREAIVNAIVHRDLSPSARGSQVQIEMYPDRIVIRNPGGLFGPVSVATLTEEATSSARNSFLLKALEDVSLPGENRTVCENRGSGIRTMVEALRSAGMTPPRFDDRISSFSVTFPNHALLNDDVVEWLSNLGEDGLTDSQCVGLALLRGGDTLDNASYRAATGVDSRVATSELGDLVSRELVVQVGSRRWTEYRLSPRTQIAGSGRSGRLAPRDRRSVVLEALGSEALSRAEIVERTGLGKQVVIHWLRILRRERKVQTFGDESPQSRNVRYERTAESWGQETLDFDDL